MQDWLIDELKAQGLTDEQIGTILGRAKFKAQAAQVFEAFAGKMVTQDTFSVDIQGSVRAVLDAEGNIVSWQVKLTLDCDDIKLGKFTVKHEFEIKAQAAQAQATKAQGNGNGNDKTERCKAIAIRMAGLLGKTLPEKWEQYANVAACRYAKKALQQGLVDENDADVVWLQANYAKTWAQV